MFYARNHFGSETVKWKTPPKAGLGLKWQEAEAGCFYSRSQAAGRTHAVAGMCWGRAGAAAAPSPEGPLRSQLGLAGE